MSAHMRDMMPDVTLILCKLGTGPVHLSYHIGTQIGMIRVKTELNTQDNGGEGYRNIPTKRKSVCKPAAACKCSQPSQNQVMCIASLAPCPSITGRFAAPMVRTGGTIVIVEVQTVTVGTGGRAGTVGRYFVRYLVSTKM